jgi:hypothetical protein
MAMHKWKFSKNIEKKSKKYDGKSKYDEKFPYRDESSVYHVYKNEKCFSSYSWKSHLWFVAVHILAYSVASNYFSDNIRSLALLYSQHDFS